MQQNAISRQSLKESYFYNTIYSEFVLLNSFSNADRITHQLLVA